MAKTKQTRRMIAMALAAAVVMSSMPVVAFAEDGGSQQTDNSGSEGGSGTGSEGGSGTGSEGGSGTGSEGGSGTGSEGGSTPAAAPASEPAATPASEPAAEDTSNNAIDITLSIPSDGSTITETFGNEVGYQEVINGEIYETTEQGSVAVNGTENTQIDTDYAANVTGPTGSNDVVYEQAYIPSKDGQPADSVKDYLSGKEEVPVTGEGSGFELVTQGATSQFRPGFVFTESMTPEQQFEQHGYYAYLHMYENEEGKYKGEAYFNNYVNYLDQEVKESIKKDGNGDYILRDEAGTLYHKDENGKYVDDSGNPMAGKGYIVDGEGNYILKKETSVVGKDKDGNDVTYWLHKFDIPVKYKGEWLDRFENIDGAYVPVEGEDGSIKWVEADGTFKGNYEELSQYVMLNKETGELITVYSEDYYVKKPPFADVLNDYHIVTDLAGRYVDAYGKDLMGDIRAIVQAGYWGTANAVVDEEGNVVKEAEVGSLDAMKEALLNSKQFTAAELDALTDGVALAATQMAIYSKTKAEFGVDYINTNYINADNGIFASWQGKGGEVPEGKEAQAALLFKLYDYLKNLDPVAENTAANEEVFTADNLLENMEITILEKATADELEGILKEQNSDNNDKNDVYKADVKFALVATPGEGDSLTVSLVDASGTPVASGSINGEAIDGAITKGESGYTFAGVILSEGQQYNITFDCVQNLKAGQVIVFAADNPHNGEYAPNGIDAMKPDMIGMTSKNHVKVNMGFSINVDDEQKVVVEKRSTGRGSKTTTTTTTEEETIFEEEVPLTEMPEILDEEFIVDEEVPLSELPGVVLGAEDVAEDDGMVAGAEDELIAATGDSNHMTAGFGGMLVALAGMMMLKRRKEN